MSGELVSFTRSYADDSHEPVRELVFLTLVEQEDGTWLSVTPSALIGARSVDWYVVLR